MRGDVPRDGMVDVMNVQEEAEDVFDPLNRGEAFELYPSEAIHEYYDRFIQEWTEYHCEFCHETFRSRDKAQGHIELQHSDRVFPSD